MELEKGAWWADDDERNGRGKQMMIREGSMVLKRREYR
jgi:hypothetical protein